MVEQVAVGSDKAERPAAEAMVVVESVAAPSVSALALGDTSAGTAADGLPLVVEDRLAVPVDIVAAAGTPAEVHTVAVADAALDTERPADSGSRKELAVVGTAEPVDATDVVERPGSASESPKRNSFRINTSSSRRSAGTD